MAYDTAYTNNCEIKYSPVESKHLLLLIFVTPSWHVFTTVRPNWPAEKKKYYDSHIGHEFQIITPTT
jgi:hypothetical protein